MVADTVAIFIGMIQRLRRIIREEVERALFEGAMNRSVPPGKVLSMVSKCGFLPAEDISSDDGYQEYITLYYANADHSSIVSDFQRMSDIVEKCGWVVNYWGNHYDAMRNYYKRFENHPEFGVDTVFVEIEPEYSVSMDDNYGTDETNLKNNDDDGDHVSEIFGDTKHLGVGYQRGIFYHVTNRGYLRSIMAHGLKPMNGGGITNWRNSQPRVYLSLLPDFEDLYYDKPEIYGEEEESDDDKIILRIDLRSVMRNFDFHVDHRYDNAVYTHSNIPPQFIEVMDNGKLLDISTAYFIDFYSQLSFNKVLEKNFSRTRNDDEKKRLVSWHKRAVVDATYNTAIQFMEHQRVRDGYQETLFKSVCDIVSRYCNG